VTCCTPGDRFSTWKNARWNVGRCPDVGNLSCRYSRWDEDTGMPSPGEILRSRRQHFSGVNQNEHPDEDDDGVFDNTPTKKGTSALRRPGHARLSTAHPWSFKRSPSPEHSNPTQQRPATPDSSSEEGDEEDIKDEKPDTQVTKEAKATKISKSREPVYQPYLAGLAGCV
jgi:hypothetical protein